MRVLVVGGSGAVGTLIVPFLAKTHALRIFDLRPPQDDAFDFFEGDVTCYDGLIQAMQETEALIYLAMGNVKWQEISGIVTAFDVNVKGLHLALKAAHDAGISQAVYASTLSVYAGELTQRYFPDEGMTPDSSDTYGFTKHLGERVCLNATRLWSININVLRLCHPTAEDLWLANTVLGIPTIATTAQDVARAFEDALDYRGGFQVFNISGDYEHKIVNMSKAKRLLGWEPLARPIKQSK
jgi:nucleoside-diphosphate-sugar epimerase